MNENSLLGSKNTVLENTGYAQRREPNIIS